MSTTPIYFKLLKPGAVLPKRATPGSGAFDLYAPEDGCLPARCVTNILIGVAHQPPFGSYDFEIHGFMLPRSGLATKHGVRLFYNGLVDNDYRGEISVCLENTTLLDVPYKQGDRICQMAYVACFMGEGELAYVLNETSRGGGGFGSTGK